MPEFTGNIFEKLAELKPATIAILGAMVIIAIMGMMKKEKDKFNTKMMVYGGLCISASFVLSYIRFFKWPQGGSITPGSMLPMFLFAVIFGPGPGIIAGMAYGLLQLIQDPYMVHWAQVFLDYPLAFGALGLAGLSKDNLALGALIGGSGRFVAHFISGVIFFGMYAPEGMSPYLYSFMVNGILIGSETLVCVVIAMVPKFKTAAVRLAKQV